MASPQKKTRVANQFRARAAAKMIRRPMEFALHHPDPPLANLGVDLGTKMVLIKFTVVFRLAVRACSRALLHEFLHPQLGSSPPPPTFITPSRKKYLKASETAIELYRSRISVAAGNRRRSGAISGGNRNPRPVLSTCKFLII